MLSKLLTLLLVMISLDVHAGVDFSMMGTQEVIPWFKTTQEAKDWANRIKWIEVIRRQLKHKMDDMRLEVSKLDLKQTSDIEKAATIMGEWECYKEALAVIEWYKQRGIMGNLGASVYASSEVVK